MSWKNLISRHGDADPRGLIAHPQNFRTHSVDQERAVRAAIAELGWVDEIVVSERTNTILNGHLRVKTAAELGRSAVPVRYVDCDVATERLILATFDPVGALAAVDEHRLLSLLEATRADNAILIGVLAAERARAKQAIAKAEIQQEGAKKKGSRQKKPTEAVQVAQVVGEAQAAETAIAMPITVKIGKFVQDVPAPAFAVWKTGLIAEIGNNPDDIVNEVRKRLGF